MIADERTALRAFVASKIAEYHNREEMRPVTSALVEGVAENIFNELTVEAAKINKLRREFDLRVSALL